jgi:hypothetical protein
MALTSLLLVGGAATFAAVSAGAAVQQTQPAPGALHLRFHRLSQSSVERVQVSGRYALLSLGKSSPRRFLLIDDRAGKNTSVRAPVGGCDPAAFGAPWIYCETGSGPKLYDIRVGRWRSFSCSVCSANLGQVDGIGVDWIWFQQGGHNPAAWFASIPGGRTYTWWPGGNTIPDLDSPMLVRKVCAPLQVPASWGPTLPPPFTFYGPFTTTITLQSPLGGRIGVYLERCGTNLHMPIATGYSYEPGGVIGNPRATLFYALDKGRATGVFLPGLRRFSFSLPIKTCSYSCSAALDARRLYVTDGRGHAWAAVFPSGPGRSSER